MTGATTVGALRPIAAQRPRLRPLRVNLRGWRPWIVPALALLIFEAAAHAPGVDARFLPSLEAIASRAWQVIVYDNFLGHLLASLQRDLVGFVIGSAAGVALGLALGFSPALRRYLAPMLVTHRQISLFAWVPLVSMWCGGGETGKIVFIALAAFQPTLANTWQGVAEIPKSYRELGRVLLFGRLGFVRLIALPCALPQIFTGLHTALIYAWTATIAAELLFNIAPGLGGQMNEGQQLFQMDRLLLCILMLGGVGVIFNLLAKALERRLLRWRTA